MASSLREAEFGNLPYTFYVLYWYVFNCFQFQLSSLQSRSISPTKSCIYVSVVLYYQVYILFWLPGMILFNISYGPSSSTSKNPSFYSFSLLIFASQPIASSIMILTKSDIRKSVLKLVTFQYCRSEQQNDTTSGL